MIYSNLMTLFILKRNNLYFDQVHIRQVEFMYARCKKNVINQFQSIRNLPKNSIAKSCILILDTKTAPLLSDLISLEELLQIGIKDLCRIDKKRKPEPASIAIYFISCESLAYLFKDFESNSSRRNSQKQQDSSEKSQKQEQIQNITNEPLYLSINLLLCQEASDDILKTISYHEQVIQKLASFGELYIPCKYIRPNVGIIPFSKKTEKNLQSLRKITKMSQKSQNSNDSQATMMDTKQQEQKNEQLVRKREHTAHFIHKDNLSCLPDIYCFQFDKSKSQKQLEKYERIELDLENFGKKICQSIIAGINFGLTTAIKIVQYESKFCNKIKESFTNEFNEFMKSKMQQIQQALMDENITGEKGSIFKQLNEEPQAKQMIIIIADRQADNLSPLIRNFYYGPLLMDVFDIKDPDRAIKILSKKIKPTVIQSQDKVFNEYRNLFIHQVFAKVDDSLQDYMSKNKAAKFHKQSLKKNKEEQQFELESKDQSKVKAKEMREVIRELPEYNKTIKSYNMNIEILSAIGNIIKQRNLNEEAELQHLLATGCGPDRKPVKDRKIYQKLLIFLENPALSIQDKCRLMVLGVCCLDIDNAQRNKLITRLSKVQGHGDIAMGLSKISKKGIKKYAVPVSQEKTSKQAYVDRHQCTLATILEQLISNNNSCKLKSFKTEEFKPFTTSNKLSMKGSLSKQKQKKIEYVVIMCGGVGYNQLSDIERVFLSFKQENLQFNLITDYIFTPSMYLEELCTLL